MSLTINEWIESGKNLPVLSGSITKLMSLTQNDESSISQIADIIKKDVGLSAAILRITNSSAFGLLRTVTSIDQAVILLGFKSVRNIAIAVGIVDSFSPSEGSDLSKIWQRSLLTGIAACELCSLSNNINHDDAFTNGLLHDIGLIALYAYNNDLASQLIKKMETCGRVSLAEEKDIFGSDHVEVGMLLAEKWELPAGIKFSIQHHHDEPNLESPTLKKRDRSSIYYLSSLVGDIFYLGKKDVTIKNFMNMSHELMGIEADKVENLLRNTNPQLVEIASYFNIEVESGKTYEQILCEANEEILNITISSEAAKHHLKEAFNREKNLAKKLEEKNQDLKILASKDALTGLYNRQFLDEILEKEWHRSERHIHPLSMAMVDIDDFKKINDTYGHKAGDAVLVKIAEAFTKNIRKNDFVARYGGEEFAFIFPETDLKGACQITKIINHFVQDLDISFVGDKVNSLSISCGVSTSYPSEPGDSVDELIKRADDALYEAKRSGKNRVKIKNN
ncbi:MAG: GGDEF domain-containing protein [Desulfobacteraceae bacterium]